MIIRSLPPITHLGLHDLDLEGEQEFSEPSPTPRPTRLCITSIEIEQLSGLAEHDQCSAINSLLWLSSRGEIALQLHTLSLNIVPDEPWIIAINTLLRQCDSLRSLRLGDYTYVEWSSESLDFSHTHSLRTTVIEMDFSHAEFEFDCVDQLASSLATLGSPLNTLVLNVEISANDAPWPVTDFLPGLAKVLSQAPFKMLTELNITCNDYRQTDGDKQVEQHLGVLAQQGVRVQWLG